MKETDAIPQRQAAPLRPIARERGWPSLTRTDITEGKWGNGYNKSSMRSFLDFLHAAGGAGCMEQLCFCSALTRSLQIASASAHTVQVGTQGKRSTHHGRNFVTGFPFLLCFPPSCMLVTCKGGADPKGSQAAEELTAFSHRHIPEQGMDIPVHCPIPKTVSVTQPPEQQFLPPPLGLHALFIVHI